MKRFVCAIILAICTVASSAAEPIKLTDGMQHVLDSIEASVLDGDAGKFMALVDTKDPEVVAELRAWFADLSRNPVSNFEIKYLGGLTYGPALAPVYIPIRIRWTLKEDEIERSITYTAKLIPLNRNNDGPWLYAGRHWEVELVSPMGLRVFAQQQHAELAETIQKTVPKIQQRIEKDFGRILQTPLAIKVYPTMADLQYSIAMGYLDMLMGWNEPGESIKILGREDISTKRLSSLLAHEIGHAVSFEFGPTILEAPWWSLEGIAEMASDPYKTTPAEDRALEVANLVERGDRRSWKQLSDFKGEAVDHSMHVYSQGWSMVRYITQRFGRKARNKWFAAMGRGYGLEEATKKFLGTSFQDLDRAWESEMMILSEQSKETP